LTNIFSFARDGISREQALTWINHQLPQEEVMRRSQFCIINDGEQALEPQIDALLKFVNEQS
jgi:dephospho-CoA kinase